MKKVWEKKKRGPAFFFIRVPLFIILAVVNILLISWFIHILYCAYTDASTMTLIKWVDHVFVLVQRIFGDAMDRIEGLIN